MIKLRQNYTDLTAEQSAKEFMRQARGYIIIMLIVSFALLCSAAIALFFRKDDTLCTLTVILMVFYYFFMLIHKRAILARFVNIMIVDCDLPKFMSAFVQVANKKMLAEDMQLIHSYYSVAYMYSSDFNSAESVLKAEIDHEKRKWHKACAKANLASLYYIHGKYDEFTNLYNEVMGLFTITNPKKYAKATERARNGLEARKKAVDKDYDGAIELLRKGISNAESVRSTFNAVINSIQLGNIELERGNKMEAAVAYGYAIQHAPQMTYVQQYIPKYEELKSELNRNVEASNA